MDEDDDVNDDGDDDNGIGLMTGWPVIRCLINYIGDGHFSSITTQTAASLASSSSSHIPKMEDEDDYNITHVMASIMSNPISTQQ